MFPHRGYVYIMASKRNGTLYIGVTNDLLRRTTEHKASARPGFTCRYGVKMLVYFEVFENFDQAIYREKQIKHWNRAWKIALIERKNPRWEDLAPKIGVTSECIESMRNAYWDSGDSPSSEE